MKYSFQLTIRDESEDKTILEMGGQSVAKTKQNCLKAVRSTINGTIKQMLERIEEKSNQG